jgi:hypothetical protein
MFLAIAIRDDAPAHRMPVTTCALVAACAVLF